MIDTIKDLLKWNIKAQAERQALERQGKRVLHQAQTTVNGRTSDITILYDGSGYTVRVNGSKLISCRTLDYAVRIAEERGYLDEITSTELRKGKAAADRLRKIQSIHSLLNRR